MTPQELKKLACEAIDAHRQEIIALGDSIFEEPELGFKEWKTSAKVKAAFDKIGLTYEDGVAITGIIAPVKGKERLVKIAVMGELDAVVAPNHRCAPKDTGAAHSCGHNAMCASLLGVAYALTESGVMEHLSGDVDLIAVPAEEYVELEYRRKLRDEGKIVFFGGKQELVRLGKMRDTDIMIMQHAMVNRGEILADCGGKTSGFLGKAIRYTGKEAHAGGAPHLGINALNAANLGLTAVAMLRETFRDEDLVRVHPIITKGGDLVNVVPADVRVETYVRGASVEAILDTSAKVSRAFKAGGDAVGAKTDISDYPGYLPILLCEDLKDIVYENLKELLGEEHVEKDPPPMGVSADAGDISHLMPMVQPSIGGIDGIFHSENFEIGDKELSYIVSAKCLAMTIIDLLADGAKKGLYIKEHYPPMFTEEQYLRQWGGLE